MRGRSAPTGCRSPRTSTCSRPRGDCPTCTTSASTGSTSRRCSAAEPGSTHGYDVVAFDHVDPSRGGAEGLAALSAEARRLGMGVLVDIVPNHVGVATPAEDAWWWDVLQHGRESEHATAFDIDWAAGDGRLLIPVVGDGDEAAIDVRDGELWYHDLRFPLAPGTDDPRGAALPARQLARGRRRPQLPPVLRGQQPGRGPRRGPRGLRRVARRDPALVRRGARRRAPGRPPRRAARPEALPRRPRPAHRRRLRARREDPRARRGPARRLGHARAPPATTRSATSTGCSPTRPASSRSTRSRPGCAARRSTGPR